MADISDSAIIAALGRQMTQAVQKQAVAAGNLANIDTPGFKAREIKFEALLDDELGAVGMTSTDSRHFGTPTIADTPTPTEQAGLQARRDGNTVQVDRELLALGRASGEFNAAQTVLAAKFRLVRYAINEGR